MARFGVILLSFIAAAGIIGLVAIAGGSLYAVLAGIASMLAVAGILSVFLNHTAPLSVEELERKLAERGRLRMDGEMD